MLHSFSVIRSFRHRGVETFFRTGSKAGDSAEARSAFTHPAYHFASCFGSGRYESVRMGISSVEGDDEESLCRQGEWELAFDVCVRWARRDSRGLYGLSLRSEATTMPATMCNPASPGELLREFMGNHSATELAEHIGVARATISRILNGRTAVTMDLSIRLGEAFSLSPDFFSKAQLQRDLWEASQRKRRKIKPLAA